MDHTNLMHIATKSSKIDITNEKNTKLISQKISKYLSKGDIIFLYGEVGVGKTTFIKHLINYLQFKNNINYTEVPSPTFNIVYEYKINNLLIKHFDLYRIKSSDELKNIGLYEEQEDSIMFVEWPELIKPKPKKRIELVFNYEKNFNKRSLIIYSDFKKEVINEYK